MSLAEMVKNSLPSPRYQSKGGIMIRKYCIYCADDEKKKTLYTIVYASRTDATVKPVTMGYLCNVCFDYLKSGGVDITNDGRDSQPVDDYIDVSEL